MGPDTPLASRPRLGRPPTARPPPETVQETLTPVVEFPREETRSNDFPSENVNNEFDAPNFEPPNEPQQIESSEPTTGVENSRPIRSTRMVPHPKYEDYETYSTWALSTPQYWVASDNELAALNHSINLRPTHTTGA